MPRPRFGLLVCGQGVGAIVIENRQNDEIALCGVPIEDHGSRRDTWSALATHPDPRRFATHACAASKGAIEALARSLAAFHGPHGIREHAIAPALAATPMSRRAQDDPEIVDSLRAKQPLAGGPRSGARGRPGSRYRVRCGRCSR